MRIIAVDDEKIALNGLVSAIEKACPGADVASFMNAKEALEFAKENPCAVAFLDIQMRGMDGIELAKQLKVADNNINIVFTTGYAEYKGDAMDLRASGYLLKPITSEKIATEIENLRHPIVMAATKSVSVHTFGNFEAFIDNKPIKFQYEKAKELFAYLVNRQGALCTNSEIMTILWEDEVKNSYIQNIKSDLCNSLPDDIIIKQRGKIGIDPSKITCDYYDWQEGRLYAINSFNGEYMTQYSWAETTLSVIAFRVDKHK